MEMSGEDRRKIERDDNVHKAWVKGEIISDIVKINGRLLSPEQMADKWAGRLVKAERDAIRDGLTGLFNHAHFGASLARELEVAEKHGWKVGILFIDLDFFKKINDEFGHPVGDKVLIGVAEIIKNEEGKTGIAGRFGGEELELLIPEAKDEDQLKQTAERIGGKIWSEVAGQAGLTDRRITVSVGATLARPDESAEDLIVRADGLMYQAKAAGRNRLVMENADGTRQEAEFGIK
jgi:diguanylate cyclase (GGDEF)-like protein